MTLDIFIEHLKRHLESLARHQETGSVTIHVHRGSFSEKITETKTTHLN